MFFTTSLRADDVKPVLLKSFNFKFYYTEGGYQLASQLIKEAESSLESMENFLGTRLVEQIDIFLSEKPVIGESVINQRNGNILLDNSSIYLHYAGNTKMVVIQLKEKLAEILINDMLFGNTIKERLKNNREINVPDWYVKGLAKYVAGGPDPNISWMADYYEGKLKLNLNLTEKTELAEFGHAVFIYINDSFGINKLRQILFYTKLSGKTEYAFQYVLNKSMNWVIADWFKLEKAKYLKDNITRLPNEPELVGKLQSADIIDIKFNEEGTNLDFLIKIDNGIEIWNYDIGKLKVSKIIKYQTVSKNSVWAFANYNGTYILTKSTGSESRIMLIDEGKIKRYIDLDVNYIHSIKNAPESGFAILAQKNYQTDIYHLDVNEPHKLKALTQVSESYTEENDFTFDKKGDLFISVFSENTFKIINYKTKGVVYSASEPFIKLNSYRDNYLSFVQTSSIKNFGMIINLNDISEIFQVTNYTRSICTYDFNSATAKVVEGVKYGKKNYVVISNASLDNLQFNGIEKTEQIDSQSNKNKDTVIATTYSYKYITGFEFEKKVIEQETYPVETAPKKEIVKVIHTAPMYEFKAGFITFGFTNTTFNSPMFASFFPVRAGLYNGPNIVAGCGIHDTYKKYHVTGHLRQPLTGKGTDLDVSASYFGDKVSYGITFFNAVYQKELYNQNNRYTTREFKLFMKIKWYPKINVEIQTGFRQDVSWPLSVSQESLNSQVIKLRQPFIFTNYQFNIFNHSGLNYNQKLTSSLSVNILKPLNKPGYNTNIHFALKHDQSFFRLFHLSTRFSIQSSVGQQKTVWLLGGVTNWLRPVHSDARVHYPEKIVMYSAIADFEGLPYNYKTGTTAGIGKIILSIPVNPIISQQNFNQNFFKYLSLRTFVNIGTAWYKRNPYSITNPDNKEIFETGSMTIANYTAKNPLVWSWGTGANSVLFGYELGFDYAIGYNERGRIGKFTHLTIGKEF